MLFLAVPPRFAWLWGRTRLPRALITALGLVLYGSVAGFSPSTVRAVLMAGIVILSRVVIARPERTTTLSAAVLIMLLVRPTDLFSASFQMSVGAVAGILLLNEPVQRLLKRIRMPGRFADSLSVTFSAQVGILPLLANSYNNLPVLGLFANLFAVPLAGLIVMMAVPIILLYFAFPVIAGSLAYPVALCARLLLRLAMASATVPLVSVSVPSPSYAMMAIFWGMAWLLSPAGRRTVSKASWRRLCGVGAAVAAVSTAVWLMRLYPADAVVTALDVGNGNAAIVRHRDNALLIDAARADIVEDAAEYYDLRFDAAILTRGDADNARGVADLLTTGRVRLLVLPAGLNVERQDIAPILDAAATNGVPVRFAQAGDVLRYGQLEARVLAPLPAWRETGAHADVLTASVGVAGQEGALFLGDLRSDREYGIIFSESRVLQAANHGSANGTSWDLLKIVRPEVAVVSVGENRQGHPSADLLNRLDAIGTRVLRTDHSGAVEIRMGETPHITLWGENSLWNTESSTTN